MVPSAPVQPPTGPFSSDQKEYLQGFMAGVLASGQYAYVGATASGQLTGSPAASATGNLAAPPALSEVEGGFGTPFADLSKPERWKHEQNGLDVWEKLVAHAAADKFPDEPDTFRFKFHGLFHVAPAQDSFMMRLRIPAGEITSHQLRGLAGLADEIGNGATDITTRANLQLRELPPRSIVRALTRVQELGLTSRGSGADNIRNVTATPTSGFDRDELIDVRPYAHGLHHYILNHRDLYGLPRKFNIAFDSGGAVSSAVDTNDIGFFAVRVTEKSLSDCRAGSPNPAFPGIEPGIYFRCELGGITGHKDFARDTGLLLRPAELVPVAAAMVRVFREHGDRTDRKKARLKYLLEKWGGFPRFLEETQKKLAFPLLFAPRTCAEPRRPVLKHGHLGVYKQTQPGLNYVGLGVPVGRMNAQQMRRLSDLADHYGQGELRLTVWQSVIIPHVPDAFTATLVRAVHRLGFFTEAHAAAGCVIACTGSKGCKYAAADTKGHARAVMAHLRKNDPALDQPVNIHLTGCNHSCAQHYCGDIGGIATKLADGREGYHVVLGGGMDHEQGIAREIFRGIAADELPALTEKVLVTYRTRCTPGESFVQWTRRHSVKELQEMLSS
ncbi:Sulfite reductase [ferredoxin] [Lacunisphaera limnophila]|uniref:Sulfite reductase [ferredoxin] n=1 Tax=Lacunisphaera limnophila TaxID=1838286 RepID=A0A1D8AZ48_9BACT|nr:NirA family protein [Lacunisphaera limnophila]AOS46172.1 Sulfite reductase [ferredoxin] [Lacunisphaera limnophila]